MSFIAKNPLTVPEIEYAPPAPKPGTRGLFAGKDGWYDVDSDNNISKISIGSDGGLTYKAYYIQGIDFEKKEIYLTTEEVVPSIGSGAANPDFVTPAYDEGDVFSVVSSGIFPFCGVIESVTNNVITWSSIDPYFERRGLGEIPSTFSVPTKPTVGSVTVGEGIFSGGEGNIAGGDYGAVFGKDNKAGFGSLIGGVYNNFPGQWNIGGGSSNQSDLSTRAAIIGGYGNSIMSSGYGLYTGNGNITDAAIYAILSGNLNKLSGNYNILNGDSNNILASFILALGKNLKTETDHQMILGKWNALNPSAAILYGNGTSERNRKNSFEINKDGGAKFSSVTDLNGNPYLKESELGSTLDTKGYLKKTDLDSTLDAKGYLKGDAPFNLKLGSGITITGSYNEAVGITITITGNYNEAVGKSITIAGESNVLKGQYLSCEGDFNYIEGRSNHTTGDFNFICGNFLTASGNQIVFGKYNVSDPDKIFIMGGGTSAQRKNIFSIDRQGNVTFAENQNLGDISTALDSIIAIQNELIGGDVA